MSTTITIKRVDPENRQQIEDFRLMTHKYLEWLGVDLGFQGIENELASLPGAYNPTHKGCMLLAYHPDNDTAIGAVALRPLSGHHLSSVSAIQGTDTQLVCEMKRLFVVPEHQGCGAGYLLTDSILEMARELGYKAIVLDTLDRLTAANKVYQKHGFQLCERYNDCPLDGVLYFMKQLA